VDLPNSGAAWIPRSKLEEYLLDPDHPTGGAKARFFAQLGYTRENLEALEQELLALARREAVEQELSTRHGTKYVLGGYLEGVRGERKKVRTIWILEPDTPGPRLVTAYPV
jgi:hypothetical protein